MKNKSSFTVVLNEPCDRCGKTPSLEIGAKRSSGWLQYIYLCAGCLDKARTKLLSETKPQTKSS